MRDYEPQMTYVTAVKLAPMIPLEKLLAHEMGVARNTNKIVTGVPDKPLAVAVNTKDNPHWSHIRGSSGEIVISRTFNIYPDMVIGNRTNDWDLLIGKAKVDVKTTERHTWDLKVSLHKIDKDIDLFFHVSGSPEAEYFLLHGWATKEEVCQEKNIREFKEGHPCYCVDRGKLHRFPDTDGWRGVLEQGRVAVWQ